MTDKRQKKIQCCANQTRDSLFCKEVDFKEKEFLNEFFPVYFFPFMIYKIPRKKILNTSNQKEFRYQ